MKCTVCWLFIVLFAILSPEVKSDCYTTYFNTCYPNIMKALQSTSSVCSAYTTYISCVKSACTGTLLDTYLNSIETTWNSYSDLCNAGIISKVSLTTMILSAVIFFIL